MKDHHLIIIALFCGLAVVGIAALIGWMEGGHMIAGAGCETWQTR